MLTRTLPPCFIITASLFHVNLGRQIFEIRLTKTLTAKKSRSVTITRAVTDARTPKVMHIAREPIIRVGRPTI